jgi:hypothetical protein
MRMLFPKPPARVYDNRLSPERPVASNFARRREILPIERPGLHALTFTLMSQSDS